MNPVKVALDTHILSRQCDFTGDTPRLYVRLALLYIIVFQLAA